MLIVQRIFFVIGVVWFLLCLVDGAAAGALAMKWREGEDVLGVTVWDHLEFNMGLPVWVRDALYDVLPEGFVSWVLGLPAGVYFPLRLATNALFGMISMRISRAAAEKRAGRR